MSLIFESPQSSPLDLVRGHSLLERLADMDLRPDPENIRNIFLATIPKNGALYTMMDHGLIWGTLKHEKDFIAHGKKKVLAYEKAIAGLRDLQADKDTANKMWADCIGKLTDIRDYIEHEYSVAPQKEKPEFFSVLQALSYQAYLLFEVMKPLVTEYNKGGKEITDSKIHIFITDFFKRVYGTMFDQHPEKFLVPAKIRSMVKNTRSTASKKKLAELHRIIA